MTAFPIAKIRSDFPAIGRELRTGKGLIYLDSAATYLKPRPVIETLSKHYLLGSANIHRGVHQLSEEATAQYEETRETIRALIAAESLAEIVFTSGTTDSINLVARGLSETILKRGDEVLITHMEHHSNIVPWQMACERTGAVLRVAPINDAGEVELESFYKMLTPKTRIASFVYVSNSLGTINPVKAMIAAAKEMGAITLIDAAQTIAHMPVNVRELDCDFLAFSGHKVCAPAGVGVLYGRLSQLEKLPPIKGGGDMIKSVTFEKTIYADLPSRQEAGTPAIGEVIALGAALRYIQEIGYGAIAQYEQSLLDYGTRILSSNPKVRIIGTAKHKASVLSFVVDGIHPHDMGTILDQEGIAVRAGHHCTQPVMARFGVPATTRASLAFYNQTAEIDALGKAVEKAIELFS